MPCLTPKQLGGVYVWDWIRKKPSLPPHLAADGGYQLGPQLVLWTRKPTCGFSKRPGLPNTMASPGELTSSVKPQGSKSERRSEQGSVASTD